MKRMLRNVFAAVAFTAAIAVSVPVTLGCASSARTAYVAAGTVDTTADAAMKSWARFVVLNEKAGTPIDPALEDQVRKGYGEYQKRVQTAEKLVREYLEMKKAGGTADIALIQNAELAAGRAAVELVHLIYDLKGGN